jgi:hypothetical protein
MRKISTNLLIVFISMGCGNAAVNKKQEVDSSKTDMPTKENPVVNPPSSLFTLTEAEKIMGESAQFTDSSTSLDNGNNVYSCSYTAIKEDKPGRKGVVYFLLLEYPDSDVASREYNSVLKANEKNGIEILQGLGDEAYFHTDNENFYFIQVRKGKKVFRIKVNKLTSKTSKENFDLVAKQITEKL